jgi:nitroimidazol reductase NimA-like FMN-containing flavoprotein (pyridoxamine 5'-phosphate oxidase superfamily)
MSTYPPSERTRITRLPKRGNYDQAIIHEILDEALYGTIAYVRDGQPFQIPSGFCRVGNKVYIHGSVGSAYMRFMADQKLPVSFSATLLDGIVLARSAFHHSMNYRSVVLFGIVEKVTDEQELYNVLEVFTNKMQPGRWADVRKPSPGEWKATMVLSIAISDASAKIRTGPPVDDEEDYTLSVWAGVVPLAVQRLTPLADPKLSAAISLPAYLRV